MVPWQARVSRYSDVSFLVRLTRAERETAARLNSALADAKEAAERATRAETRAAEIERRADDLNAELGRVHEQNTALIAAIPKPAADTDKG